VIGIAVVVAVAAAAEPVRSEVTAPAVPEKTAGAANGLPGAYKN